MEDGAAFLDDMFELWQIAGSRLDPSFVQFPPEVMNQKLEKYAAALSRCEGHYKTLSGLMGTARQVYADARKIAAGEDYGQKLAGRKSRSSTPQLPADARLSAAGEDYEQKLAERMRRSSSVQGQNSRQSNVANNIGQSNQFSVPALLARQKTKSSSASPVKGAQTRDENSVRETIHNSLALRRSASIPSGDPLSRLQSASSPLITRSTDHENP